MEGIYITGATGGLGRELVKKAILSDRITKIYCQFRNDEKFNTIFSKYNPAIIKEKNLSNYLHAVDDIRTNKIGTLTIVLTEFTISPIKRIGTMGSQEVKENLEVNVEKLVRLIDILTGAALEAQIYLKIIYIDSGAAYTPLQGWGLYSAAKAYANMYLKTLQLEQPEFRIISYEPGLMDTQMQSRIRDTPESVCNRVNEFVEYKNKQILQSPELVAEDLFQRFVINWEAKSFHEGYKIK